MPVLPSHLVQLFEQLCEGTQVPAAFGEYPEVQELQAPVTRLQELEAQFAEQLC